MKVVNLSNRPFINERPVKRLAGVLWALGAVLLAVNIQSYWTYWLESAEVREEYAKSRDLLEESQGSHKDLGEQVAKVDLAAINQKAYFLNQLIERRTFPWSQLFDDLEEVLEPHYQIQLESVQPNLEKFKLQRTGPRRRGRRSSSRASAVLETPDEKSKEVILQLHGVSKSSEAVLAFVDTLFDHPSFLEPNPQSESEDETTRLVTFDIDVVYLTHIDEVDGGADTDNAAMDNAAMDNAATAVAEGGGSDVEDADEGASTSQPATSKLVQTQLSQDLETSTSPQDSSSQASPSQAGSPPASPPQPSPSRASSSTLRATQSAPEASTPSPSTRTPSPGATADASKASGRGQSSLRRVPAGQPVAQVPPTLRPRPLPPPSNPSNPTNPTNPTNPREPAGQQGDSRSESPSQSTPKPTPDSRSEPQPEAAKPNFDSEEASATPRLQGGGS